jgi:hypothetical protein
LSKGKKIGGTENEKKRSRKWHGGSNRKWENYMVVGDKFIRNEGFLHISDFQKDLTLKGENPLNGFDIIEVYAEIVALKHLNDNTKTLIWIRL